MTLPLVVVISGLDPCGAAGLFADIRALTAANVRIAPVISAITVQGKFGISRVDPVSATTIRLQLQVIFSEYEPNAVKIGVLGSPDLGYVISEFMNQFPDVPFVLDPVHTATLGGTFANDMIKEVIMDRIVPQLTTLTPNRDELKWLTHRPRSIELSCDEAAQLILMRGCKSVVVKGGHAKGDSDDWLYTRGNRQVFHGSRLSGNIRGTGCHHASYLAAQLAHGVALNDAVYRSQQYVRQLFSDYDAAGCHITPAWLPG